MGIYYGQTTLLRESECSKREEVETPAGRRFPPLLRRPDGWMDAMHNAPRRYLPDVRF
jgi:hypothetical protein